MAGKSRTLVHPETISRVVQTVTPASATNYDIVVGAGDDQIPLGSYHIYLQLRTALDAGDATITVYPLHDDGTIDAGESFILLEQNDNATTITLTVPVTSHKSMVRTLFGQATANTVIISQPIPLLYGIRVAVTVGTVTADDVFRIEAIFVRAN